MSREGRFTFFFSSRQPVVGCLLDETAHSKHETDTIVIESCSCSVPSMRVPEKLEKVIVEVKNRENQKQFRPSESINRA